MAEELPDLRLGVFRPMASIVPAGQIGKVKIEHLTITDRGGIHALVHGAGTRNGTYALLKVNGGVVMSDTDLELRSNMDAVLDAKGDVLIGGLGLGMITLPILAKPHVRSVLVVELRQEVIDLVRPHIVKAAGADGPKLQVVQGDIRTWQPATKGRQFDYIYFDIWNDICADNRPDMVRLHRAFRPYLRKGGHVTSWQWPEYC